MAASSVAPTLATPAAEPLQDGTSLYRCGSLTYTKRGLIVMFAWMLWGDFCFTLMEAVVPSVLPLKLHSLEASDTLISVIMTSLPAAFNFTITPAISMWSDRLRTRWGRRMPFILGSMPFLTLSLVLIGLNDVFAAWVHHHWFAGSSISQAKVAIIVLAFCAGMFDLFNMFVNTVYWYLFNDIVPEQMMGRFMAQFRIVGTLASMLYNFLIFRFAESHMREIYIGAAVLYFVGFGLVCLRVREGTYPPPETNSGTQGFLSGLVHSGKTFARECFTNRYYWYFILEPAIGCMAAFGPFFVFFNKSLGLTLGNIGYMNGVTQAAMLIGYFFAGRLVDRWHPVRVSAYLTAYTVFAAFNGWIWLVVDRPNPLLYAWIAALTGVLFSPVFQTVNQVAGMTRWMRLLPREKLGQFNGAMCLVRAAAIFLAGFLAGGYIDLIKYFCPPSSQDPEGLFAYRFIFLLSGVIAVVSFVFHYKVYRGWKRLGGDTSYQPPEPHVAVHRLPSRAEDHGEVSTGLLRVAGWMFLGSLLGLITWLAYYLNWEPNARYAATFCVSAIVSCGLFYLYRRFIRFMERP